MVNQRFGSRPWGIPHTFPSQPAPIARDVADGNRELHISTVSIDPEGMCVAVRDTGDGLRPESLPRLFEPFYTTKPDGMGMGLSICRSIIEAHDGRLWATRREPRGALFQFTIPAD